MLFWGRYQRASKFSLKLKRVSLNIQDARIPGGDVIGFGRRTWTDDQSCEMSIDPDEQYSRFREDKVNILEYAILHPSGIGRWAAGTQLQLGGAKEGQNFVTHL